MWIHEKCLVVVGEYDVYQYHGLIFFLSGGMELCNAYTELNDPVLQREAFAKQVIADKLYSQFSPTLSYWKRVREQSSLYDTVSLPFPLEQSHVKVQMKEDSVSIPEKLQYP